MANFNFNNVIIGGRLTDTPELKQTPTGISVTTFTVAVNRKVKQGEEQKADFIDCVAWRGSAEFITKYFRKGSSIFITGSLAQRVWTDSAGKKHPAFEVVVRDVDFVDSLSEKKSETKEELAAETLSEIKPKDNFAEYVGDDELPF